MKAIKRTVAALLATLMLATSTSFTLAATAWTEDDVIVAKVGAAGIMVGNESGEFMPEKSLTRAEAAKIIVVMKGIKDAAVKSSAGLTNFSDVAASHWASGYINQANNLGIVKGVSATEFAPDRQVTVAEFVTMAVRALGAGTLVDSEGTWPANYVNFAAEEGLMDGVAAAFGSVCSRMDAARMVANSLEADMWVKAEADTNSKITYKKSDETILNDVLDIDYLKGIVVSDIDLKERTIEFAPYLSGSSLTVVGTYAGIINDYKVDESINIGAYGIGDEVDVWFKVRTKEMILIVPAEKSTQQKVAFTKIVSDYNATDNEIEVKVNGKDKKYKLHKDSTDAVDVTVVKNGDVKSTFAATDFDADDDTFGELTIVNGKVTVATLNKYAKYGVVKSNDGKNIKVQSINYVGTAEGFAIKDNKVYNVTKDGKAADIKDIEEEDSIFYYTNAAGSVYYVDVFTKTAEGKVTLVDKTDDKIVIDGEKYDYLTNLMDGALSTEVIAYLNRDGKIFAYDEIEGTSADVAVVLSYRETKDAYELGNAEVVLKYVDGTKSEVLTIDMEKSLKELTSKAYVVDAVNHQYDVKTGTSDPKTISDLGLAEGQVICYSVSGNKLTVMDKDDTKPEYANVTIASLRAKTGVITLKSGTKVTYDSKDYTKLFLTEDAKIFVVKDGANSYDVKVNEVALEDLDDFTASSKYLVGYVAGIDKNNIEYLVIDERNAANATLDKKAKDDVKFALVLKESDYDFNNDDKDDYAFSVVFAGEDEVKTIYWVADESSDADLTALEAIIQKKAALISVDSKNIVTDVDVISSADATATLGGNGYIVDIDTAKAVLNDTEECDEKVIVVRKDGKNYLVESLSSIDTKEDSTDTEYDEIIAIGLADTDDKTSTAEVISFIIVKEHK